MTEPTKTMGLGAREVKIGDNTIQLYRPWWSEVLAGAAFAVGALAIYAALDFMIDGKLDLRHLRRNGR